jgi:disulfide bond formation protein DsbB
VGTKQKKWRYLGIRLIKWTVIAALGFFAVLLLERLAIIL